VLSSFGACSLSECSKTSIASPATGYTSEAFEAKNPAYDGFFSYGRSCINHLWIVWTV